MAMGKRWARRLTMITAGMALFAPDPAGAGPNAYVAESQDDGPGNVVVVVDTATQSQIGSITLPDGNANGIAITPDGTRAYVSEDSNVDVIDTATNTVVKSIPLVARGDVAINPDGKHVYVTDEGTNSVQVIDTATNTVTGSIPVGDRPRSIVVNSAGTRAYTGDTGSPESVSVIDLTTNSVATTITSGLFDRPENIGISPDGSTVWAANFGASAGGTTVTVIDTASNSATQNITVGTTPDGVEPNPAGTRVYVADRDSSQLSVIDTASKTVVGTIALPLFPTSLELTPDASKIVVTSRDADKVAVVDAATGAVLGMPLAVTDATNLAIPPVQSPVAALTANGAAAGSPSAFDASGSSAAFGRVARFDWSFGDGSSAANAGPTPTHTYAAAGTYTASVTVSNDCDPAAVFGFGIAFGGRTAFCNGRPQATASRSVVVPAAPVAPLTLTGVSISPTSFLAQKANTPIAARRAQGTRIRFRVNRAATVRMVFRKLTTKTRSGRGAPRYLIQRARAAGSFTRRFTGRIGGKALTSGRWRMTITASAGGVTTKPQTRTFTILRP